MITMMCAEGNYCFHRTIDCHLEDIKLPNNEIFILHPFSSSHFGTPHYLIRICLKQIVP